MAVIAVYLGPELQSEVRLASERLLVGRNSKADIVLDSPLISRRHAAVFREPATRRWMIEDLSGRNGLFVNGAKVRVHAFRDGDSVEIGKHLLVFRQSEEEHRRDLAVARGEPGADMRIPIDEVIRGRRRPPVHPPARPVDPAAGSDETVGLSTASLAAVRSEMAKRRSAHLQALTRLSRASFPLDKAATVLGSGPEADIMLPGLMIGARHALVEQREGRFSLMKTGGLAALKVNGEKIGRLPRELADGDLIEIAGHRLKFVTGIELPRRPRGSSG